MKNFTTITTVICFVLIAVTTGCVENSRRSQKQTGVSGSRPNIIVVLVDDMGFSDIGCYGSEIETPNIDKLAQEGLRFTQFYNTGRCCPTRASLLTGLYPHNTGMGWMTAADLGTAGYTGDLNNKCITIAQAVKPAGYKTYMSGKWHVTADKYYNNSATLSKHNWPEQRGFDRYFGSLSGGGSYFHTKHLVSGNNLIEPPKDFYYTHAITDSAVQYIQEHENNEPFFLYVAHFAPHYPLHALPADIAKHRGNYKVGWDSIRSLRYQKMKELGLFGENVPLSERNEEVSAWEEISEEEKDQWDKRMSIYAAQVSGVDEGVGKIVQTLKAKGIYDNTLILFLSDNGACAESPSWQPEYMGTDSSFTAYDKPWANASNTPFRLFKKWAHEGGIATPLIVQWPGMNINKGGYTRQVGHIIDIMPTLLEVSEVGYPKTDSLHPLQGKSLVAAFLGDEFDREPLFWEHEANRAVRDGNWKLVSEGTINPPYTSEWELYNLEEDRTETNNLIDKYPEKADELKKLWEEWAETNNVYPLDGRGWFPRLK